MANYDEPVSDQEKVRIVSDFILHSPPGEFNEVFNDVRVLLNNDTLLKEEASHAFAKYNKSQLTPCRLSDSAQTLITESNQLSGGRFLDPRSKQSFRYDHLRKEASDIEPATIDEGAESWRKAVEDEITTYQKSHYKLGVCSVFGSRGPDGITITVYIESHQFNPKNYWNGRWRSQWEVVVDASSSKANLIGVLKAQVHYYEDGNVQLVSSKDCKESILVENEGQFAKDLSKIICEAEGDYQNAISVNYQTMSESTFKALRRMLPVTRTKMDWHKILGYKIGGEISKSS